MTIECLVRPLRCRKTYIDILNTAGRYYLDLIMIVVKKPYEERKDIKKINDHKIVDRKIQSMADAVYLWYYRVTDNILIIQQFFKSAYGTVK